VIKQIAPKIKEVGEGFWSPYIEQNLIPRLHGFELLMASYAMCHLKLDMMLTELGYRPTGTPPRLSVYLTNSLEEGESANQSLPFAQWLSNEVKAANTIKRDMPIMCVLGNPPYLGEGGKSEGWFGELMYDYKKEPEGKEKLKERNPKWLNDLYVKFIRLSSHYIEKNGEGVLGFITNHGYLDNLTFRGMRWHLLHTFDKIYILDLHGNTKKKEVCPDGSLDKNVFDIQQGVAIMIAVKHSRESRDKTAKPLAQVFHADLWGDRASKYETLNNLTLSDPGWKAIQPPAPQYAFVQRDYRLQKQYEDGFAVDKFFTLGVMGFQTHRDHFAIADDKNTIVDRCLELINNEISDDFLLKKYNIKDNRDWSLSKARLAIKSDDNWEKYISLSAYRPLDNKYCYLSYVMMDYPRTELIQHGIGKKNLFIGVGRQGIAVGNIEWCLVTCSTNPIDANIFRRGGVRVSPLYLYPDESDLIQERKVNFDDKLFKKLKKLAKDSEHGEPNELHVFDYIYGVLHNPQYRQKYAEFLKIDFPRIPFPKNPAEFWRIASKGALLRQLHLMDSKTIGTTPYSVKGEGDFTVDKPNYRDGKIYINATQYFDNAPEIAWTFYIGGYQPAQKWLKDRKGRTLTLDDVKHYQKILKILAETDRVMGEIESE